MKKSEEQMIDHLRDADHSKRSFPVTESMSAFLPAQGNFKENPQVMKNSCRIDKQREIYGTHEFQHTVQTCNLKYSCRDKKKLSLNF